jgi:maltose O-acetyltransferase
MISKAARSIQRDLTLAGVLIFRNSIAGSVLVPQIVRTLLYRLSGLDIRSFNIREGQTIDNSHVQIGERTFVNRKCTFEGSGVIAIGSDCQLGPETMFITSTHERRGDGSINNDPRSLDIRVEDGAWIGARSVVLPGTVIEKNCIIAAGAVVRGRCLAGMTYGGVPARLLTPLPHEDSASAI